MTQPVREGAIDLSLIRLPDDALILPALPELTKPRDPSAFSKQFRRGADALGFDGFEFHHLRGTHSTLLLDKGVPVHVAAERIGDDLAALLRNYAKRKRKQTADTFMLPVINAPSSGISET